MVLHHMYVLTTKRNPWVVLHSQNPTNDSYDNSVIIVYLVITLLGLLAYDSG